MTVGPLAAFGIIYGKFLASLGDESGNTTIVSCIFNTVICFMGLLLFFFFKGNVIVKIVFNRFDCKSDAAKILLQICWNRREYSIFSWEFLNYFYDVFNANCCYFWVDARYINTFKYKNKYIKVYK